MLMHSFLFIPDISGFTKFVNNTAISHSQHIISELLELIIDADELGLEVSEIEGDAVLFFGRDTVPGLDKITEQVKKTFIKFHEHLSLYDSQRICQCGACSTASGLSLKFVAHCGEMQVITVKGGEKPYGPDVIMAHRLLKNDVPSDEYLLVTDPVLKDMDPIIPTKEQNLEGMEGKIRYEDAGSITFKYVTLDALHSEVGPAPDRKLPSLTKDPAKVSIYIDRPVEDVYDIIINFERRLEWSRGLDAMEYNEKEINRLGSQHKCIIGKDKIGFETITNDFGKDKLVYGERILKAPFTKDVNIYYIVEKEGAGTRLSGEAHVFPTPVIGPLFKPLVKKKMLEGANRAFAAIKEVMESGQPVGPPQMGSDS